MSKLWRNCIKRSGTCTSYFKISEYLIIITCILFTTVCTSRLKGTGFKFQLLFTSSLFTFFYAVTSPVHALCKINLSLIHLRILKASQ